MSTDRELLDAWAKGAREAGNELFVRHFDAVFRFFFTRVGQDAEELTQATKWVTSAVEQPLCWSPKVYRGPKPAVSWGGLRINSRTPRSTIPIWSCPSWLL